MNAALRTRRRRMPFGRSLVLGLLWLFAWAAAVAATPCSVAPTSCMARLAHDAAAHGGAACMAPIATAHDSVATIADASPAIDAPPPVARPAPPAAAPGATPAHVADATPHGLPSPLALTGRLRL